MAWEASLLDYLTQNGCTWTSISISTSTPTSRRIKASSDIPPQKCLMTLTKQVLLTPSAIWPLYPSELSAKLSGYCILSLHLAVQRHKATPDLFVQSLPSSFNGFPLWMSVLRKEGEWVKALGDEIVPLDVKVRCNNVQERFTKDWGITSKILVGQGYDYSHVTQQDFLWGWLSVNSRCIWFDQELPEHEDNVCLAPFMDMFNHDPSRKATPYQDGEELHFYSSSPTIPPDSSEPVVKEGEEVCFSYGGHDDAFLMAEYGFMLGWKSNPYNSVDISDEILKLFEEEKEKLAVLDAYGYKGDYSLHPAKDDEPAYASYRTLMALRLLHIENSSEIAIMPWLRLCNGVSLCSEDEDGETINPVNENKVKASMARIIETKTRELEANLERLKATSTEGQEGWREAREMLVGHVEGGLLCLWDVSRECA